MRESAVRGSALPDSLPDWAEPPLRPLCCSPDVPLPGCCEVPFLFLSPLCGGAVDVPDRAEVAGSAAAPDVPLASAGASAPDRPGAEASGFAADSPDPVDFPGCEAGTAVVASAPRRSRSSEGDRNSSAGCAGGALRGRMDTVRSDAGPLDTPEPAGMLGADLIAGTAAAVPAGLAPPDEALLCFAEAPASAFDWAEPVLAAVG